MSTADRLGGQAFPDGNPDEPSRTVRPWTYHFTSLSSLSHLDGGYTNTHPAWAAVTRHHSPGGLQQTFTVPHSGGQKSSIKARAGMVPPEACLLGAQMAVFFLGPSMAVPLYGLVSY